MRVWDIPQQELCDKHLVAEHSEIHAIWSVITNGKRGFARHPEVSRWRENLPALVARHDETAAEMLARRFRHSSSIANSGPPAVERRVALLNSLEEQRQTLVARGCRCGEGRKAVGSLLKG